MNNEPIAWGVERHTYTREQLEYLDECFNLNWGRVSSVITCALSNKQLFGNFKTPDDIVFLVWLIENRQSRMAIMNGETSEPADRFEISHTFK